jgi:orotate phosphoribosyltransferase
MALETARREEPELEEWSMDEDRERLKRLLIRYALRPSKKILVSGNMSDGFVEARKVTLSAVGAQLVGRVFLRRVLELNGGIRAVGGMEGSAAPPIAVATSIASSELPEPQHIETFLIRRQDGFRGGKWVEGFNQRAPVALVEDVVTSGISTVKVIQRALEVGLKVSAVICLVDREEGAMGQITPYCSFHRIFTLSELFELKNQIDLESN